METYDHEHIAMTMAKCLLCTRKKKRNVIILKSVMHVCYTCILLIIRSVFAHMETLFQLRNSKHIPTNYITYHTHIQNTHTIR